MAKSEKKGSIQTQKKLGEKNSTTAARPASGVTAAGNGIQKKYLSDKRLCEVTFKLPRTAAAEAKRVSIVGDFNDWDSHANRMKRLKNGDFSIKIHLEPGRDYQFRYLIDESRWENDWQADSYVKSPFGDSENSVVKV